MFRPSTLLLITFLCAAFSLGAQKTVKLVNPSFEGRPACCAVPQGWESCGTLDETPPDIQPGFFQVSLRPQDGSTYLGLVVRDNGTSEGLTQGLASPLLAGHSYVLYVCLARSPYYTSLSRLNGQEVDYNTPAVFELWAGDSLCDADERLVSSGPVSNENWIEYQFQFKPSKNFTHIYLHANFDPNTRGAYNGNILVDKLSIQQEN